jgi:hypothetical protein
MATHKPSQDDWMTPTELANRSKEWRRRSRTENRREAAMGDFFGSDAALEIEAHQRREQRIDALIGDVMSDLNMGDKLLVRTLLERWNDIVGAEFARHTAPCSIEYRTLHVEVSHPAVHHRLQPFTDEILRRVQHIIGSNTDVTQVKLVAAGRTAGSPKGK